MKYALVLLLVSGFQALALNVSEVSKLPVLQNVKINVVSPGQWTAVQPQGKISFEYSSCGTQSFDAEIEEANGLLLVKIIGLNDFDCAGPRQTRQYVVQYSSDASGLEPILVLNPQSAKAPLF